MKKTLVDLKRIVTNPLETAQYIKTMGGTVRIDEDFVIWDIPAEDVFTVYDNRNAAVIIIYKLGPDIYLYVSHGYLENKRQVADKKTMVKALSEPYDISIRWRRGEGNWREAEEVELEKKGAIDAFLRGKQVYNPVMKKYSKEVR